MSSLFISHSSRDNAAAQALQAELEKRGHRSVFLDLDPEAGIQAGVSWERTLYTKLRACRAVVALCSDSYLASQWCFAEIALARMEGKELFVLQIDPWSEGTQMPSILTEEQFIDLRTNAEEGYRRLWNGFKVKGIVAAEAREWKPTEPPYPGLRAFRGEDAPIFFGRDEEIRAGAELLNRVRRQGHPRLAMVLGSSGSGKSSLVRAGIVPRLRRDRSQWLVVKPFRPGRQPVRELAASLSTAFDEAGQAFGWEDVQRWLEPAAAGGLAESEVESSAAASEPSPAAARERLLQALHEMEGELTAADGELASSVRRLVDYLGGQQAETPLTSGGAPPSVPSPLVELASRLRLQGGQPEASVVLVIDQFEELLGHDSEHPASRFLAMLRAAIEAEDSPLLVIGTMRSDYLGALQGSTPLQGLGFKSLSVGPMSGDGMRQVIEEPARLGQIELEKPGLTERLLRETGTPDALPLLAFTLRTMWDRYHATRRFDVAGYEALGGLQGAIAQVADDTLEAALAQSAGGTEKDLRVAFLSLARPAAEGSGWARQPVSWDELPARVQPMIQHFIDQRLLVKRADGTVEVAHEALFRSWETLRGWLDANAEGLHLLREIRIDAEKWEGAESEADKEPYLWRSGRLARAVELRDAGVLALKDLDRIFIEASSGRARRRRQVQRAMVATLAVLTVVAGVSAFVADRAREVATQRRAQAEDLISFMLVDLRAELKDLGKLDILELVGDRAMDYFAVLGDDLSGGDALARVMAVRQIGEVRRSQGRLEAAHEAFSQSRDYAQALHEAEPSNNDYLFQLGQAEFWVGYAALEQGHSELAEQSTVRYMDVSRDLLAREPDNPVYQLELAYAHNNLGAVALNRGDAQAALSHFNETVSLSQQLVAADPEKVDLRFELAGRQAEVGSALLQLHRIAEAESAFQEAFDTFQALIERDPQPRFRARLADMALFLADIHVHQGDIRSAEKTLQLSLLINDGLVAHEPKNARWRRDGLWIRYCLAHLHYARGTLAEQESDIRGLMRELTAMQEADKANMRIVEDLSLSERLLALAQLNGGDDRQALETIERAWGRIELLQSRQDAGERTTRFAALVAETLGRAQEAKGSHDLAQETWGAALAMLGDETSSGLIELAIRRQLHTHLGNTTEAQRINAKLEEVGFADPRYFPSQQITPR